MSRIGNKPITIPAGVEVTVNGSTVTTKGPKGTLTKTFQPIINVEVKDNLIYVTRPNEEKFTKQLHAKEITEFKFYKQLSLLWLKV